MSRNKKRPAEKQGRRVGPPPTAEATKERLERLEGIVVNLKTQIASQQQTSIHQQEIIKGLQEWAE